MTRLRAWLELARLSNLPTVWTGALVGFAAATATMPATGGDDAAGGWPAPGRLLVAAVVLAGLSLLYVAGMVLNDVLDVEVDRRERPGRPIPSGRVSIRAARCAAITLFIAGLACLSLPPQPTPMLSLALALSILAYDALHLRSPWSVLLMGLCRAWVYLVAAAAFTGAVGEADLAALAPRIGPIAACIAAYTVAITIVSRAETHARLSARRWLALLMPAIALAPLPAIGAPRGTASTAALAGAAAVAVVAWLAWAARHALAQPPRTGPAIMAWLAGLCLIDALYLALLGQPILALFALACFALTTTAHRRIAGT